MNGKKENNRPNFTDSQSAIDAENAARKPARKNAQPTFKLSSKWTQDPDPIPASTNPPKATTFTPSSSSSPRFYTENNLNIPLYNAAGKRITHARDGRVLLHKYNKKTVLNDVVRKYAGDAVAQAMESWTNDQIGDWITEVETRAFGKPPKGKGKGKIERKEGDGEGKRDLPSAMKHPGVPPGGLRRMSLEMARGEEEVKGRVTRSMSEEMRALLGMGDGNEEAEVLTRLDTQGTTATGNGYPLLHAETLAAKRKSTDATNHPPKRQKPSPHPLSPPSSPPQPSTPSKSPLNPNPPPDWFPWPATHATLAPPRSTSLIRPRAVRALALTPHWTPSPLPSTTSITPLRVLPLRSSLTHTLLLSTPSTLHILRLPHHDLHSQRAAQSLGKKIPPPHRRVKNKPSNPNPLVNAYLKEGKHGYDWEGHRWGFEGDKDLVTGVGHQVEERDREAYGRGELWRKYTGRRGGLWPCGCRIVGNDGEGEESEEE